MTAGLLAGFNTGIQRSWIIIDNATQLPVPFGGDVLDLESSPMINEITIKPISTQGYDKFKDDRSGWEGTMTVARNNGDADNFEAAQEALYHSIGGQKYFTIYETTINDDNSIDEFVYAGATLKMTNSGSARKDSSIDLKFKVRAQSRQAPGQST